MKRSEKITAASGFIVLILAALFSIALLLHFFNFGLVRSGGARFFLALGSMLYGVYGFSCILIPLFLCVTGLSCFAETWSVKKGIILLVSVIPFFTVALTERFARFLAAAESGPLLTIKICALLTIGALLIAIEYIAASIAGDKIQNALLARQMPRKSGNEADTAEIEPEAEFPADFPSEPERPEAAESLQTEPAAASQSEQPETQPEPAEPAEPAAPHEITVELQTPGMTIAEAERLAAEESAEQAAPSPVPAPDSELYSSDEAAFIENPFAEDGGTAAEAAGTDEDESDESDESDDLDAIDDIDDADDDETYSDEDDDCTDEAQDFDDVFDTETDGGDCADSIDSTDPAAEAEPETAAYAAHSAYAAMDAAAYPEERSCAETIVSAPGSAASANTASANTASAETASASALPLVERAVPARIKGAPYHIPVDGLLTSYPDGEYWIIDDETLASAGELKDTLSEFKIAAEVTGIRKGPVITMFEILPAPGVKLSKIVALQDNIALRLAASSVRIVAPIPGKHAVGIEVPNKERAIVSFKELIETEAPAFKKYAIPVILGKDITGEAQIIDLAKTPHLLIAGSTGSGKSVCVNTMILSILYKRSPQDVKMILIDPKIVELKLYNDIPHLLTPVITEPKKAFQALQYCLCEMERRYALLDGMGVREIASYNRRIAERNIATEKLPYIVIIIDEFADLMATTGKELESTVARLAAMSRAVGIHLVLATQRPSIDVITGLIKANIPTRIAFMVASKMDSRIIIDQVGAEKLLGRGDMLYASATDPFPVRIQGTFVSDTEVENVVEYVKQYGEPEYIDDEIFVEDEEIDMGPSLFSDGDDPLYEQALEIVVQAGKASASYIQRRLKIGYNRAARLVEEMEARGIVGPANGSKPRDILQVP